MRLLVDTHTLLWFAFGDSRLSQIAGARLTSGEHQLFFSTASAWEIAIKVAIGKLSVTGDTAEFIWSTLSQLGAEPLVVSLDHALRVATLPVDRHRDPFDRLLVAQCLVEDLTLVSGDTAFDAYPVARLW